MVNRIYLIIDEREFVFVWHTGLWFERKWVHAGTRVFRHIDHVHAAYFVIYKKTKSGSDYLTVKMPLALWCRPREYTVWESSSGKYVALSKETFFLCCITYYFGKIEDKVGLKLISEFNGSTPVLAWVEKVELICHLCWLKCQACDSSTTDQQCIHCIMNSLVIKKRKIMLESR